MYLSYLRSQLKSDWIRQGGFEVAEQLSLKSFFYKVTPLCHFRHGVFLASSRVGDISWTMTSRGHYLSKWVTSRGHSQRVTSRRHSQRVTFRGHFGDIS